VGSCSFDHISLYLSNRHINGVIIRKAGLSNDNNNKQLPKKNFPKNKGEKLKALENDHFCWLEIEVYSFSGILPFTFYLGVLSGLIPGQDIYHSCYQCLLQVIRYRLVLLKTDSEFVNTRKTDGNNWE
jgi:hypothetical protein